MSWRRGRGTTAPRPWPGSACRTRRWRWLPRRPAAPAPAEAAGARVGSWHWRRRRRALWRSDRPCGGLAAARRPRRPRRPARWAICRLSAAMAGRGSRRRSCRAPSPRRRRRCRRRCRPSQAGECARCRHGPLLAAHHEPLPVQVGRPALSADLLHVCCRSAEGGWRWWRSGQAQPAAPRMQPRSLLGLTLRCVFCWGCAIREKWRAGCWGWWVRR